MKIFLEVPVWLGDTVMASVAVNRLMEQFPDAEFTVFGSFVATEIYKTFPRVTRLVVDDSKQHRHFHRLSALARTARSLGRFDDAFTFRRSFTSKWLMFWLRARRKFKYARLSSAEIHLVQRYVDFINHSLHTHHSANAINLHRDYPLDPTARPLLGLNPGATYGSAKRWYPQEFAQVAQALHRQYDIVIFGGKNEVPMADDIEQRLRQNGVDNLQNLAGKTDIDGLCAAIAQLNLFITNDSGPMHLAAAFQVPTVAIFGPTKDRETHQWHNPREAIVRKPIECAPCMQRECPLGHHLCMKSIHAADVLARIPEITESST